MRRPKEDSVDCRKSGIEQLTNLTARKDWHNTNMKTKTNKIQELENRINYLEEEQEGIPVWFFVVFLFALVILFTFTMIDSHNINKIEKELQSVPHQVCENVTTTKIEYLSNYAYRLEMFYYPEAKCASLGLSNLTAGDPSYICFRDITKEVCTWSLPDAEVEGK